MAFAEHGACVGTDPDLWHPRVGLREGQGTKPYPRDVMERARPYCSTCPVRVECHAWALANELDGIWANTDPHARRQIRRALRLPDPLRVDDEQTGLVPPPENSRTDIVPPVTSPPRSA